MTSDAKHLVNLLVCIFSWSKPKFLRHKYHEIWKFVLNITTKVKFKWTRPTAKKIGQLQLFLLFCLHLLKGNHLRIIALNLLYITLPMQDIHKIYFLPNIRSFLNEKKNHYKSVKTWNELQIPKLNLLELVRPKLTSCIWYCKKHSRHLMWIATYPSF